jgi:REP element-mobilizing transposase RayT
MKFLNSQGALHQHGDTLPHWQQQDAVQFVTFRLGDSLPSSLLNDWKDERDAWVNAHPKPWSDEIQAEDHRKFSRRIDQWLDQGVGSCVFTDTTARKTLAETMMRFQGEKVIHHAWVIMPNHVHVLFSPMVPMETLIGIWKSHSSRLLKSGSIWQRDYRDTLVRDWNHFQNVARYIRRNPLKANLAESCYTLWESELVQQL